VVDSIRTQNDQYENIGILDTCAVVKTKGVDEEYIVVWTDPIETVGRAVVTVPVEDGEIDM